MGLLSQQEGEWPQLFPSLQRALAPLLAISSTDRAGDGLVFAGGGEEAAEEAMAGPCAGGACAPIKMKTGKPSRGAASAEPVTKPAAESSTEAAPSVDLVGKHDDTQQVAMRNVLTHTTALILGFALA